MDFSTESIDNTYSSIQYITDLFQNMVVVVAGGVCSVCVCVCVSKVQIDLLRSNVCHGELSQ